MRRPFSLLLGLLVLTGALGLPGVPTPVAGAVDTVPVTASAADSLVDSYGVGVHLNWLDTPYADATKMIDALSSLGVRHIRDDYYLNSPRQYAALNAAAAKGIKVDLITGRPTEAASPLQYVTSIAANVPNAVESLEGTNEWDISGRPAWTTELIARQTALYAAAKANPRTAGLPVLAGALAFHQNYGALGSVASIADQANGHLYAGGRMPSAPLDAGLATLRSMTGAKPVVITEAGYNNALSTTNGHLPAPEDVVGAYMPRLLLDSYRRGAKRVYSYELLDAFPDTTNANVEAHFGLLRHDLTAKPAYTAMKRLLALTADPGASFTPGSLSYAVEGAGSDVRQLLVQKRTGQFVLFLWRDVSLWDQVKRVRTSVTPTNVTLRLGSAAGVQVFRPTSAAGAVSSAQASSVPLSLDGQVTAVTIDPSTPPSPVEPPSSRRAPLVGRATLVGRACRDPRRSPAGHRHGRSRLGHGLLAGAGDEHPDHRLPGHPPLRRSPRDARPDRPFAQGHRPAQRRPLHLHGAGAGRRRHLGRSEHDGGPGDGAGSSADPGDLRRPPSPRCRLGDGPGQRSSRRQVPRHRRRPSDDRPAAGPPRRRTRPASPLQGARLRPCPQRRRLGPGLLVARGPAPPLTSTPPPPSM